MLFTSVTAILVLLVPFAKSATAASPFSFFHRTADIDVDLWWDTKPVSLADLGEIQVVDIKDLFEAVGRVRLQIRAVAITRRLV